MAGVESCIRFSQKLSESKINSYCVPFLKKYGEDKSWRIRYLVADKIIDISKAFGEEITISRLLPQYVEFLGDQESEVRTAAITKLSEFIELVPVSAIQNKIIPALPSLQTDTFQYVRIALAENLMSLCPKVGKALTNEHILPIFLILLRDESTEVRLALFQKIESLN